MQSVLPLHLMYDEGVFTRNVKFTPLVEGFQLPPYFQNLLEVMSLHKVGDVSCHVHVYPEPTGGNVTAQGG